VSISFTAMPQTLRISREAGNSANVRCVFFVSFIVRRGSISPTFSTFLEAVHAGLLIVKLLWRLQLLMPQPNRAP
jgi:hypothetical protein